MLPPKSITNFATFDLIDLDYPMNTIIPEKFIYLNTPACGLVPDQFSKEGIAFYESLSKNASRQAEQWRDEASIRIRKTIADFLEAPANNIAMIPNFSFGMNAVVQSLKGTETILLYDRDYPSLTYPFLVNQFNIAWFTSEDNFTIHPETIEQKLKSERIDLLAISQVQWLSGTLIDLKRIIEICHQFNIPVIVDCTQSLGALPISIKDLNPDVLIASNYKWMNAGFGTGIMYLSDSFLEKYPPSTGGFHSFEQKGNKLKRTPSALDFEPGHTNMAGFSILEAAVLDKSERGLKVIENHNQRLTSAFTDQCAHLPVTLIGSTTMQHRCSIIVLKDENGLGSLLQKNNFIVTHRNATIRLGFHYYNTMEEVTQLTNCIRQLPEDK